MSLARPHRASTRAAPHRPGFYTTYREDPQYQYSLDAYGRPVLSTYYVKVPIGTLIVAFANGTVVSVEQHKTDPNSPGVGHELRLEHFRFKWPRPPIPKGWTFISPW